MIGPMSYDEVVGFFGSQAAAGRKLGVTQPAIARWKKNGISYLRQLDIQRRTRGRLKADPLTKAA